ncbi:hypothetical protein MFM001_20940 [Mycobacterium sp. MFM001]|nr:hypothetical protein MFM001_20940 [Mycobacterium sp. MFM001]
MSEALWVPQLSGGVILLSANVFAIPTSYDPLVRAATGAGLALAAFAAIGCGSGVAGATPQQPVLVDDPAPVPAVSGNGVNIANAIFGELGNLLNAVLPGSGSLFMPATSDPSLLSPAGTLPSTLPPGTTAPGTLGTMPPGTLGTTPPGTLGTLPPGTTAPGTALPGQTPALPTTPGTLMPGQSPVLPATPGTALPGQTPPLPTSPGTLTPGQTPGLPTSPGIPAPAATSPTVPAQNVPVV